MFSDSETREGHGNFVFVFVILFFGAGASFDVLSSSTRFSPALPTSFSPFPVTNCRRHSSRVNINNVISRQTKKGRAAPVLQMTRPRRPARSEISTPAMTGCIRNVDGYFWNSTKMKRRIYFSSVAGGKARRSETLTKNQASTDRTNEHGIHGSCGMIPGPWDKYHRNKLGISPHDHDRYLIVEESQALIDRYHFSLKLPYSQT